MRTALILSSCSLLLADLSAQTRPDAQGTAERVLASHAAFAHAIYVGTRERAANLEKAIQTFLERPDATTLDAARRAWIHARELYGMSEVLRFQGGPIDDAKDGPETLINAWPLDEGYIDVVVDRPAGGILQDRENYPNLNATVLSLANERGGEANVCVGWHAIEFMLWGQDLDPNGPGRRSPEDFREGASPDAARRAAYLRAIAELLVHHLEHLEEEWAPERDNYRRLFLAAPSRDSLRRILTGMVVLSGFELAGERMAVAYETKDQEEEHSCFSDTTHLDLIANQKGILAVYTGEHQAMGGIGLRALAREVDPPLAAALDHQLRASLRALEAIPAPFDRAIQGEDDEPGRKAILRAIEALEAQTETLAALGLNLGFEIPVKPTGF